MKTGIAGKTSMTRVTRVAPTVRPQGPRYSLRTAMLLAFMFMGGILLIVSVVAFLMEADHLVTVALALAGMAIMISAVARAARADDQSPRAGLRARACSFPFLALDSGANAAFLALLAFGLAFASEAAQAQDRAAYQQRSIARYTDTFASHDLNHDGAVSRKEVEGNIEFTSTFDDIDINRDGIVTKAELDRFLEQRFGTGVK